MHEHYYLGLDQGTTGTTAILFDEHWNAVSRGYEQIPLLYPRSGWVEHDARAVWTSVLSATAQALAGAGADAGSIRSIGLDHEGESVVVWDKLTGEPIHNTIVWQDRRTAHYADSLVDQYNGLIHSKTGLMIDSYFSATKLKWILDHAEGAAELAAKGRLLAGTMDTWIIWKMTHGRTHITDASTASRTMLFNLESGDWDQELLDLFEIDRSLLPEIRDSASVYAWTDPLDFLGAQIPISGILVDQQAALVGQACVRPGMVKTTYGTGCFMLMNTGETPVFSESGLLPTVAWQLSGKRTYALDGGVYITGGAVRWLQESLNLVEDPRDTEQLALQVPDNGGVYFVPAFTGLAAPHWDSYASGMVIGITGGTQKAHIVRAALEATCYQVRDVLDVMRRDSNVPITAMRCNGRATANRFLMQFQSDVLDLPLEIPERSDTTAFGSAFMGALGLGEFEDISDAEQLWRSERCFEPRMDISQQERLLYRWHRAVERSKYWRED
ncbi:glycerol kinase GlpK [Oscillibacter sp. MSJ-2]|uniref:ATP:glycerol 3-phosphotransferase n=1 Tax=Dysosmobacter acutus TaxID=2841504 RepID=A0ABS6FBP1_9FIRM|nr:glycerol kinase GlpK [Dysosmobacter acutus]MBU5627485.1 glycerol kinase GlpK [Dysosmobacter acutus]